MFVRLQATCLMHRSRKHMKGPLELTQSWLSRWCHMIIASGILRIWTSSLTHSNHFALRSKTSGNSNPTPARLWRWSSLHRSNGQLDVGQSWLQQCVCASAAVKRGSVGPWYLTSLTDSQRNCQNGVGRSHLALTSTIFQHVKLWEITWEIWPVQH